MILTCCSSSKVYPIIRNLDMKEEDETLKDLIYKLVELLMLDEEPQTSSSSSSGSSSNSS
jgi:hypothetical protein